MTDYHLREHIGIAIDGGGVRGAIVAHGLIELENILGTRPLIDDPRVNVLAGTSTGSLITAALAVGMTGEEILALYNTLGKQAFSQAGTLRPFGRQIPLLSRLCLPIQLVRLMDNWAATEFLLYLLMPARYSFEPLRRILRSTLKTRLGSDPTLGQLGDYLSGKPNRPTLITTAVDVAARQTLFLRTTPGGEFAAMPLVDALTASCAVPTYFDPVLLRQPAEEWTRWLVDGGVGSFGNPALAAARELCDERIPERQYPPSTVTLYSFGTGYVPPVLYERTYGQSVNWWALEWASRIPDLFWDSAVSEQARNIVTQYRGIDLRRFQVTLDRVVLPDRWDLINTYLREKGEELRRLLREDQHAISAPQTDPEGILDAPTARLLQSQRPDRGESV